MRRRPALACGALLGMLAACAPAEPETREVCQPLDTGNTVVQIGEISLGPQNAEGQCRISGTVLRSFLGNAAVGEPVSATINCTGPLFQVGLGGTAFDSEAIRAAEVIEIHIRPDGEVEADYGYYEAGFAILDAPTEARSVTPESCLIITTG